MRKLFGKTIFTSPILGLGFLLSFGMFVLEVRPNHEFIPVWEGTAWAAMEEDTEEEQEFANNAERAVLDLAAKNAWFKRHVTQAKAIFVAPDLYRGRVLTGGNGLLLVRQDDGWSQKAFYRVEVPDLGLNLGTDRLEIVLLIRSHMGVTSFYSGGFQLGRGLRIADGLTVGESSIDDLTVDVIAFTRLQSTGTYTSIPLRRVRITVSDDFNQSFYGATVEPLEILNSISVSELGFSGLLSALRHPPICPKGDKSFCNIKE